MSPNPTSHNNGRRKFCKACIGGLTVLSAGTVAFPVVSFLGLPQRLTSNKPLEIPLDKLVAGQAQYAEFQGQQIIVLATAEGPAGMASSRPRPVKARSRPSWLLLPSRPLSLRPPSS